FVARLSGAGAKGQAARTPSRWVTGGPLGAGRTRSRWVTADADGRRIASQGEGDRGGMSPGRDAGGVRHLRRGAGPERGRRVGRGGARGGAPAAGPGPVWMSRA